MVTVDLYYFAPSAPCRSVLLVARTLGLDVNIKHVNLFKKEQFDPEFIKINPQHTVPTLKDGDFVLWDSHAIASYLVQKYGKDDKLYPRNPQQKAIVDQRMFFNAGTLFFRIRDLYYPVLYLGETKIPKEKVEKVKEAFGWMDSFLTGRPWLAGADMTIADIVCATSVSTIIAVGYDISVHAKTNEWYQKCVSEIPDFDENVDGAKVLGDIVKSKLELNQL